VQQKDFKGVPFQWSHDYIAEVDADEDWLIEPILPSGGAMNIYGKPKSGKSFLALGMAIAVADPGVAEWNGFKIGRHGPVLYVQMDTPRSEWKRRKRKVFDAGYSLENLAVVDMKMSPYPFNVMLPTHLAWLQQQTDAVKPILVVYDVVREMHEEDENDSSSMKRVMSQLVRGANGAASIILSHSRKDSQFNQAGSESDIMDEGRGSSYISGRMDTIVRLTTSSKEKQPLKGNMTYKGRSVEQTKLPVIMDGESSLFVLTESDAKLDQLVGQVTRDNPTWSRRKQAQWIVSEHKGIGQSTAERRLTAYEKLRDGSPEVSKAA
jgi:RecA-family ATPase